mmetsp:Transcript_35259/g.108826  ORF Transcript_35259/g.108826 Transcript_35259/m.108826 type:complete len:241 (-) Transcript_35259:306-1028(-)
MTRSFANSVSLDSRDSCALRQRSCAAASSRCASASSARVCSRCCWCCFSSFRSSSMATWYSVALRRSCRMSCSASCAASVNRRISASLSLTFLRRSDASAFARWRMRSVVAVSERSFERKSSTTAEYSPTICSDLDASPRASSTSRPFAARSSSSRCILRRVASSAVSRSSSSFVSPSTLPSSTRHRSAFTAPRSSSCSAAFSCTSVSTWRVSSATRTAAARPSSAWLRRSAFSRSTVSR